MDLSHVILASPRLKLESFRQDDAAETFAAVTPGLCRYLAFDPSPTPEDFARIWTWWLASMQSGGQIVLTIRDAGGAFVGLGGLHGFATGCPEFGLWIREASQERGFGTEVAACVIDWAGASLGYRHIHYHVVDANTRSRRIVERLGGIVVGTGLLRKPSGAELPMTVYRVPTGFAPIPREDAPCSQSGS
jgi:RimJ/RimL family protein N-acetyltransferase